MGNLLELNDENFDAQVLKSDLPVLVDFAAEWCPPCKVLGPVVEQIAEEYAGKAVVAHVDVDKAPGLAMKYQIRSVPTLLFFKGGEVVDTSIGAVPKRQLTDALDALLSP
jgi:thioredoxin 1